MLDHFERSPGFESSVSAGLKLEAVFADEIFLAGCAAIAAAVKRHTQNIRKRQQGIVRTFTPVGEPN
jgi:hypothetical protein